MTEQEIQELERQRRMSSEIKRMSQEERVEYNQTRDVLVSRIKGPLSHYDVRWAMLQSESLNHIRDNL